MPGLGSGRRRCPPRTLPDRFLAVLVHVREDASLGSGVVLGEVVADARVVASYCSIPIVNHGIAEVVGHGLHLLEKTVSDLRALLLGLDRVTELEQCVPFVDPDLDDVAETVLALEEPLELVLGILRVDRCVGPQAHVARVANLDRLDAEGTDVCFKLHLTDT